MCASQYRRTVGKSHDSSSIDCNYYYYFVIYPVHLYIYIYNIIRPKYSRGNRYVTLFNSTFRRGRMRAVFYIVYTYVYMYTQTVFQCFENVQGGLYHNILLWVCNIIYTYVADVVCMSSYYEIIISITLNGRRIALNNILS